jgi:5-methylcytosine-specific restriction protein A
MAITHGHGNPNWNRDETILALDLYFDFYGVIPSGEDERIKSLSQLLRSMPYHANASKKDSFRNADGVSFKLQNLRQVATGKGLGNVSKMDRIIWSEFANKPEEAKIHTNLIKAGITLVEMEGEDSDDDVQFAEGRIVTEAHKRRERNPQLRRKLIKKRKLSGPLSCDICNCVEPHHQFADAMFEAHHLVPLAAAMQERATKLQDMSLLCANCHRMNFSQGCLPLILFGALVCSSSV